MISCWPLSARYGRQADITFAGARAISADKQASASQQRRDCDAFRGRALISSTCALPMPSRLHGLRRHDAAGAIRRLQAAHMILFRCDGRFIAMPLAASFPSRWRHEHAATTAPAAAAGFEVLRSMAKASDAHRRSQGAYAMRRRSQAAMMEGRRATPMAAPRCRRCHDGQKPHARQER